jgi:hypothetical protein
MSQGPIIIPNTGTLAGIDLVNDINAANSTLNTNWLGATAPTSPQQGQLWLDSSVTNLLIERQYEGTAWVATGRIINTAVHKFFGGSIVDPARFDLRLTFTSGVPVTISDVTGATTVYLTPDYGNIATLYTGAYWVYVPMTEVSLSLATGFTAGNTYDIYLDYNGGAPALNTIQWTNSTTPSSAPIKQDGVYVQNGAPTRRYVGTIYMPTNTTSEDSAAKRYLWSYYGRRRVNWIVSQTAVANWTYSSTTVRQANANTALQLDGVVGIAEDSNAIDVFINASNTIGANVMVGVGVNSTTVNSAQVGGGGASILGSAITCSYKAPHLIGRNYYPWLESSQATGVTTWNAYSGINLSAISGQFFK